MTPPRDENEDVARERDRLRRMLERAHAAIHDGLNATPLDSPEGTACGHGYEYERVCLELERVRAERDALAAEKEDARLSCDGCLDRDIRLSRAEEELRVAKSMCSDAMLFARLHGDEARARQYGVVYFGIAAALADEAREQPTGCVDPDCCRPSGHSGLCCEYGRERPAQIEDEALAQEPESTGASTQRDEGHPQGKGLSPDGASSSSSEVLSEEACPLCTEHPGFCCGQCGETIATLRSQVAALKAEIAAYRAKSETEE